MQRPMTRDLSAQAGNPTNALQAAYKQLMTIQDPQELMDAAIQVVQPMIGKGISQPNYAKFMMNLRQSAQRGVGSLQQFLTNYILKGSGLGVAEDLITASASFMVEGGVTLTVRQKELKTLVESNSKFYITYSNAPLLVG